MRLDRVLAVAWRDLRLEFAGRQGVILPLVATMLLMPFAAAPSVDRVVQSLSVSVSGDVPAEVLALEGVVPSEAARVSLTFLPPADDESGQRVVVGPRIPHHVREALDAHEPTIAVLTSPGKVFSLPKRSLFLALLAASMLTGSLAQSIPGERSSHALEVLLTAAITRTELLAGKWLAWGGYGAVLGLGGSFATVALGRQAAGLWLLAVPWVALGTAALGFWLVRRANDVVGGATVVIRLLPVTLTVLGLAAWFLGDRDPWLGASVPLGGALVAAGDRWADAGPVLWAITVTAIASVALLWLTARDLEPAPAVVRSEGAGAVLLTAGTATAAWWCALLASMAWAAGGNEERTLTIDPASTILAGGLCLAALVLLVAARDRQPGEVLGVQTAPALGWALAFVVGGGLALVAPVSELVAPPVDPATLTARLRFGAALVPAWAGFAPLVLVVVTQELLFRGWLRHRGGDVVSILLWVACASPLDPSLGIVSGAALVLLVRASGGSVLPAVAARLLWALAVPVEVGLTPLGAAAVAGVGLCGLWLAGRLSTSDEAAAVPA